MQQLNELDLDHSKNKMEYIEEQIQSILSDMNTAYYELDMHHSMGGDLDIDYHQEEDRIKDRYRFLSKKVFRLITYFFEQKKALLYLEDFKSELAPIISDDEKLFAGEYIDDIGETVSATSAKIWLFLSPFKFSSGSTFDHLLRQSGLKYLETILSNTQAILNKINFVPKSEPQVYNSVKFVIQTTFPSSQEASSNFLKCFKSFNADILVPELQAAIEYKYADNEKKLKAEMEQIAADTKGYTGSMDYKLFYAVFYVTDDFWGAPKFEQAWKEMDFPANWKGFYIVGKK